MQFMCNCGMEQYYFSVTESELGCTLFKIFALYIHSYVNMIYVCAQSFKSCELFLCHG